MIFILHFRGKSKIIADQYNKKHLLKPALFGKLTFLRNFVKKISLFCCARKKKVQIYYLSEKFKYNYKLSLQSAKSPVFAI